MEAPIHIVTLRDFLSTPHVLKDVSMLVSSDTSILVGVSKRACRASRTSDIPEFPNTALA
jgi:hypothetical protein